MIQTFNLTKIFEDKRRGKVVAADNINFSCKPGEIFGLLGLNGAGKTTTLRLLATSLKPTSGTAQVFGFDIVKETQKVKEKIGFLTGDTSLYPRLTADETVTYFARLYGMDNENLKKRKEEIFKILGIDDFKNGKIDKLSLGQKQKVSIARTVIHDPPVLILDEPTARLDVISARNIVDFIKESKRQGKCVLFSTHIMHEAAKLCDVIAIIHKGKILEVGTLPELQEKYKMPELDDIFVRIVEERR
ncbi:MAG: ABC transporter ATP-binding protein [candidate division Zixibacteria bacterium RBG_16_40_9]|nr:MAG: ABC transporter ATP-binding protein [candidate division Zixibacteria bacterium RBG_16_40_9]